MPTISYSVVINQSADKIFNHLIDLDAQKSRMPGLKAATLTPPGPVALGSIYTYTTEVMGRNYDSKVQVSAFEPNKKWATKTIGLPNSTETSYTLEPAGAGTKTTIEMVVPAGAYPAAAEGAIMQQMQKSLVDTANGLKAALE